MTALEWDKPIDRTYETGLDRGVLYLSSGEGVVWNGLTGVDEQEENSDPSHIMVDGVKIFDVQMTPSYAATVSAFTYPEEFLDYEGSEELTPGLRVDDQRQKPFGMSYRTLSGSAATLNKSYKIHILYNLTAVAQDKPYQTISELETAIDFSWSVRGVPEALDGYKPTAHIILDSDTLEPDLLEYIESIIYGDGFNDAYLPNLEELWEYFLAWDYYIAIIDHGTGIWKAISNEPGVIDMLDSTTFEITTPSAVFLDADTYEISSLESL